MLTLTQDCAIPSLFAATHEEAYDATKKGFASWPKTKWSWGGELAERQIDPAERPVIGGAILQVVENLERGTQRVRRRPGVMALAV